MAVKLNGCNNYESIIVRLSEKETPIAFANKLHELMSQKCFDNIEDAKAWIEETPFEMDVYYEEGKGLFCVESDAVDNSVDIYSPYTGELCDSSDLD